MANALIIGKTEFGKSFLAKYLCEKARGAGRSTLVYDVLETPWPCELRVSNREDFLRAFWASESCEVFIDEGGETARRYDDLMEMTATRGRHRGHQVYYISQRGSIMSKTIRTQCVRLFLFNTAISDARDFADDYGDPRLLEASTLEKGEFFYIEAGKKAQKMKVIFKENRLEKLT